MSYKIIGKVDLNRTVEELVKDRGRSGADVVDLRTCNLMKEVAEIQTESVSEDSSAEGTEKTASEGKPNKRTKRKK